MNGERNLEVLLTEEQISKKVSFLGELISRDYAGAKELVLVAVLRGSVYFAVDLSRQLSIPFILDFIGISSYAGKTDPLGIVRITKDLDTNIARKNVLLVEDIVDTGLTLNYLLKNLRTRNPLSLRVCTFLDMPARRIVDVPVDYRGFEMPDVFVVGYGLDYQECYRNLKEIAVLK
ncbi:MAG: hypoxanthine phosphoribosyltransferase [Dethiobacter sp.]|jgi:hypoxanthine phosphoribosyltransferase|nr:MAG: hypoxanthine phosphoribosyltransferase [Dethiobacter sp.]